MILSGRAFKDYAGEKIRTNWQVLALGVDSLVHVCDRFAALYPDFITPDILKIKPLRERCEVSLVVLFPAISRTRRGVHTQIPQVFPL